MPTPGLNMPREGRLCRLDSPLQREARRAQFRAPPECADRPESGRQELPLHALTVTEETPKPVLKDARLAIAQSEKRIDRLMARALLLIGKHPELQRVLTLLTSIKGIAETSAIALMGELLLLPPGLSHRAWVEFAGLDSAKHSTPARVSTRKRGCPRPVTGIFVQP